MPRSRPPGGRDGPPLPPRRRPAVRPEDELRSKDALLRDLGYGGDRDLVEAALQEAGISNPWLTILPVDRIDRARRLVEERFLLVCGRPECREEAAAGEDGRTAVPASEPRFCEFCGGSANARAVEEMAAACRARGWRRICVVGGSPSTRAELERLAGAALELRLVDGTLSRHRAQADADMAWADVVVVWGGTQLAHSVSLLYKGPNVVQMARRGIREVARAVITAAAGGR